MQHIACMASQLPFGLLTDLDTRVPALQERMGKGSQLPFGLLTDLDPSEEHFNGISSNLSQLPFGLLTDLDTKNSSWRFTDFQKHVSIAFRLTDGFGQARKKVVNR